MGGDWLEAKNKQAVMKVEADTEVIVAKAKSKVTIAEGDAQAANDIDLITVKNKNNTWMDNIVVCTILSPFWLYPVPFMQPYVENWLEWLSSAPDWYQYAFYGVIISELGLRRIFMKLFETLAVMRTGKNDDSK
mgnify:CR=1 FL=1